METSYHAVEKRRVSMCGEVDGFSLDAQEPTSRLMSIPELVDAPVYTDAGISAKRSSKYPALEQLLRMSVRIISILQ